MKLLNFWKKWLNADYAFSNNGEKIKKIIKCIYTIEVGLVLIAAVLAAFTAILAIFDGQIEVLFLMPIIIIVALFIAPFLFYWLNCLMYGYAEIISNSYTNKPTQAAPFTPATPVTPVTPVAPAAPVAPAPSVPAAPVAPATPVAPAPAVPVTPAAPATPVAKRISITYLAEPGAPFNATYIVNRKEHRAIVSGQTVTELISSNFYQIDFIAGEFRVTAVAPTVDNTGKRFICSADKLEER